MRKLVLCVAMLLLFFFAAWSAYAAVVYRNVVGQGDLVEFYDEPPEWCGGPGGFKALWTVNAGPRKGEKVRGCWRLFDETVQMMFEDGDRYAVPLEIVRKLHERGGV